MITSRAVEEDRWSVRVWAIQSEKRVGTKLTTSMSASQHTISTSSGDHRTVLTTTTHFLDQSWSHSTRRTQSIYSPRQPLSHSQTQDDSQIMTMDPSPPPTLLLAPSTAILRSLKNSSTTGTVSLVQAICNAGGFCNAFTAHLASSAIILET